MLANFDLIKKINRKIMITTRDDKLHIGKVQEVIPKTIILKNENNELTKIVVSNIKDAEPFKKDKRVRQHIRKVQEVKK